MRAGSTRGPRAGWDDRGVSTDGAPRIRVMARADVDLAVEWAAREGWNPGLADAAAFHAADPGGFLLSEHADGTPVACLAAVRQGDGLGFAGFYIVAPERRGQGHGIAIWQAGMARLAGRTIGLDGVVDQQDAYRRSGFALAWRNRRHGADAPAPVDVPAGAAGVVDAAALPLDVVDRLRRPDDRGAAPGVPARVADAAGARRARRGARRAPGGPGRASARAARGPRSGRCSPTTRPPPGRSSPRSPRRAGAGPLFLDVPGPNADAAAIAAEAGMAPVFETARMYAGPPPAIPLDRVYGVTSFELG